MSNREITATLRMNAVDRTGKAFGSIAGKMDHLSKRAGALNTRQMAVARLASGVNDSMLVTAARYAGPAALGAAFVYAGKQAATFEQNLFGIQKKSGATSEQMAKIKDEIFEVGRVLPVSIDEITAAFERGAAAGIPLDELADFAKITVQVADAWDTTAEGVGNTFAGFTAGMGIARKDLMGFASLINDLADSGIADEVDIADFLDRSGATLKGFGMTPEEIAGYGAAMLNLKMPAEVAARAMNTLSSKLLAPENLSKKAKGGLKAIVGDVKAFSKLSGDQKMMTFLKSLQKLDNQKRASYLGALLGEGFSDEIARVVAGLDEVERNLEMVRKNNEKPSNSIAGVTEAQLDLFNKQMQLFKNNLDALAITAGNAVLPTATEVLGNLNKDFSKDAAVQEGMRKLGYSWVDRAMYMSSQDDIDKLAMAGGYKDPEIEKKHRQGPPTPYNFYRPEFPGGGVNVPGKNGKYKVAGDQGLPSADHPIRKRPDGKKHGYGEFLPQGKIEDDDLTRRDRPAPADPLQAAKEFQRIEKMINDPDLASKANEAMQKLQQGGEQAGEAIKTAGQTAGETLGNAAASNLQGQAGSIGAAIAAAVAPGIVAAVQNAQRAANNGGTMGGTVKPPAVNADTGRSMPQSLSMPNGGGSMP